MADGKSVELIIGGGKRTEEELKEMGDYDDGVYWQKWSDKPDKGLTRDN